MNAEIAHNDQFARKTLESFFRFKLEENKDLFADGIKLQTDRFSTIAPATDLSPSPDTVELDILSSRSVCFERKMGLLRRKKTTVQVIPCIVGDAVFYAYLTEAEDNSFDVTIASNREHGVDCRKLLKKNRYRGKNS